MYVAKSVEEITALWDQRRTGRAEVFERMRTICDHYNNDVALPLPEVSGKEPPAVANLIAQGIDQHSMRVASVLPDVQAPPVKIGDNASEKRADQRRRASIGFWEQNNYELLAKQRARWLVAYAESPIYLLPDKKMQGPRWVLRNPLNTYPAHLETGQMQPDDCIFAVQRTVGWVKSNYPDVPVNTISYQPGQYVERAYLQDKDKVEVLTYIDENETVVVILGQGECETGLIREAEYGYRGAQIINLTPPTAGEPRRWAALITRVPNRLGEPPVVCPSRISLETPKGQFDDNTGLFIMQAKLMAMEVNAVANSIWPDQWVTSSSSPAKVIKAADGRKGILGEIQNGTIETVQMQPGLQTPTTIDRLERGQRLNGAIPADFGGESASNIRTGRRGENVLSAAVDYVIQEHQQILARSGQTELQIAANIDLTYFRNTKKSYYVSWKNGKGRLDYTPASIWSEDRTLRVSYAKAGADKASLIVELGQEKSLGLISGLTAARLHPDIADPEFEADQVQYEMLRDGLLQQLPGQLAQGALAITDYVRVMELVRQDKMTLEQAIIKANQEAQQRQAAQAPADAPEAQPGMSPPDAGQQATVQPPAPSIVNLAQLVRATRSPAAAARGA